MSKYNKKIVKEYIKKAKVTCFFIVLCFVMFAIEVVMSWAWAVEPGYGISQVSP